MKREKKALVVRCSSVFLMSNIKKLLNLIISLSLLYLVLCSIPYFRVIFYMFLVIYLINQFPYLLNGQQFKRWSKQSDNKHECTPHKD